MIGLLRQTSCDDTATRAGPDNYRCGHIGPPVATRSGAACLFTSPALAVTMTGSAPSIMLIPPSTTTLAAVIQLASSEARNSAQRAMSQGCPILPSGIGDGSSASPMTARSAGVSVGPGLIELTLMRCGEPSPAC